nr:MAG TPA: hypothetical protein [Caudoviricetes sp.]
MSLTRYVTGTPNKRAIASSSSSCQRAAPLQRWLSAGCDMEIARASAD